MWSKAIKIPHFKFTWHSWAFNNLLLSFTTQKEEEKRKIVDIKFQKKTGLTYELNGCTLAHNAHIAQLARYHFGDKKCRKKVQV